MAIKNHQYGNLRYTLPRAQTGAVLLAFILVFIVASSFYLTKKLNTNLLKTQHSVETGIAMKAAKNALIGYAVTFPEVDAKTPGDPIDGPGYLPCPDLSNNGSAGGSCSLNGITSIGRFPYKTLEAEELRDGHGERLWYVVSDNFRNNPKMIPLNTETAGNSSGDMTVDGYANIAAVIFSAGAPENNQNRISANENDYTHYIEATFTDSDGDAVIDSITTADTDRYILLTKDELMQMVEKRVLGQTSQMLSTYLNSQGAYPWLTPFSDPKADVRRLTGTANSGSDSTTLIDTSVNIDFVEWGVAVGDVVWNVTDGSIGFVSSVDSSTQLTITGMSLGTENDFDEGDAYQIQLSNVLTIFSGTATLGSTGLKLVQATKDFDDLGITEGDILENVTDGSSGIIDSIDDDEITVTSLSGGTGNDFASGDSYLIRTNSGTVTADSTTALTDTKKDFFTTGIVKGDLVHNVTDGSYGIITDDVTAATATVLTVALEYGTDNDFTTNDIYSISRFNPVSNTREGHLAFHDRGEPFTTGLDIELYLPDSISGVANSTVVPPLTGTPTLYEISINQYVQGKTISGTATGGSATTLVDTSRNFNDLGVAVGDVVDRAVVTATDRAIGVVESIDSDTQLTISTLSAGAFANGDAYTITHTPLDNITDGVCVWATADIVECVGTSPPDTTFLSGTGMGSDNHELYDTSKDFPAAGVKRGDILENTTAVNVGFNNSGIVESFNSKDDMKIENIEGYDHAHVDNGQPYRLHISTSSFSGTATAHTEDSGGVFTMTDTGGFPVNVAVGDVIENTDASKGGGLGRITDITGNVITATKLSSGGQDEIRTGQDYKIHSDHISERKYTYRLRFSGFSEAKTSGEIRTRVVCAGYTDVSAINDCDGSAGKTDLGLNYVVPGVSWVTMTDVDSGGVQLGQATLIPNVGAYGFIKVAGMDYYLREDDDEIPTWFIANNWHQLTYVAYSAGDSPGGGADCTVVGGTCLTLSGGGAPTNNKRALVVSAGSPLAAQDRSSSLISDYYESGNNNTGDDGFQTGEVTAIFNDQNRVLDTSL